MEAKLTYDFERERRAGEEKLRMYDAQRIEAANAAEKERNGRLHAETLARQADDTMRAERANAEGYMQRTRNDAQISVNQSLAEVQRLRVEGQVSTDKLSRERDHAHQRAVEAETRESISKAEHEREVSKREASRLALENAIQHDRAVMGWDREPQRVQLEV